MRRCKEVAAALLWFGTLALVLWIGVEQGRYEFGVPGR